MGGGPLRRAPGRGGSWTAGPGGWRGLRERLARACAQLREWCDEDLGVEMLSVNVSARQLASGSFSAAVRGEIGRNALDPSRVSLEITESALMEDVEFSIESLVALEALGVGL